MEEQEEDYDYEYDDEFEADEPDYYSCTVCNHTQDKPGMGNGCYNCGLFNVMQEEYF